MGAALTSSKFIVHTHGLEEEEQIIIKEACILKDQLERPVDNGPQGYVRCKADHSNRTRDGERIFALSLLPFVCMLELLPLITLHSPFVFYPLHVCS